MSAMSASQVDSRPKLTSGIINMYALANSLNTAAFTVPTLYLTMFMTDFLGISPIAIGSAMGIAKAIDFLVSIVAGAIIEKAAFKKSKYGKYLTWVHLLTFTLFFGNIVQMLDTSAFVSNREIRLLIVCIFYIMFHSSMNFNQTARSALIVRLAGADMNDRKKLTARQAQYAAATSIIVSAITLPMITFVSDMTGREALGYFLVSLLFSASFLVCNLIFCKMAVPFDPPERQTADAGKQISVAQMFKSVFTNPQMMILFLGFTLMTIGSQVNTGVVAYFFRAKGIFAFMTVALTARSIVSLLASMVGPGIGKKIGKKGSLVLGFVMMAVGCLIAYLFGLNKDGSPNKIMITVSMCVVFAARYIYMVFMANYYLDCGEYGYYKTGMDNRTMAVTVMNWPTKIGFAVGGSLMGYGIAWAGYIAPTKTAPCSFTYMNRYMMVMGLLPAILIGVSAVIILLFYKLSDAEAERYAKINDERETKAQQAKA